jgi:hypothetical protein
MVDGTSTGTSPGITERSTAEADASGTRAGADALIGGEQSAAALRASTYRLLRFCFNGNSGT